MLPLVFVGSSGGEAAACLLHRPQRLLGASQRSGTHINARRLRRDRDLLAGGGVVAQAFLLGWLA